MKDINSRNTLCLDKHYSDRYKNFYLWCNGGWMKKNPIPAGYPSWNTFLALHVQSQER